MRFYISIGNKRVCTYYTYKCNSGVLLIRYLYSTDSRYLYTRAQIYEFASGWFYVVIARHARRLRCYYHVYTYVPSRLSLCIIYILLYICIYTSSAYIYKTLLSRVRTCEITYISIASMWN